jgi:hypothetical protein
MASADHPPACLFVAFHPLCCLSSIDQLTPNRHPGPAVESGFGDDALDFYVFCPDDDARFNIETKPIAFGMQVGAMTDVHWTAVFM